MSVDMKNTSSSDRGSQGKRRVRRYRPRPFSWFFFSALVAAFAFWGACLGAFVWVLEDAEDVIAKLDGFRPKVGSKVYSSDGEMLGEFTIEARELVPLSEMPLHLQKAFIATEDDTFYSHYGVRPLAIAKALAEYAQGKQLRGASTITQQTVRNIEATGVSKDVKVSRKIKEALIALQLERRFTKDEILEIYMNQIFLGVSAYGVEAASRQYYGKSCRRVTLSEAATLAGLTRAPNRNNPFVSLENARTRRNIVLGQMLKNELITRVEYERALRAPLEDSVLTPEERRKLREEGKDEWTLHRFKAPYFVTDIRQFILHPPPPYKVPVSQEDVFEDGLEIRTTLDWKMQQHAEEVLYRHLDEFDAMTREKLERQGKLDEFVPVSGALVCLDNRPEYAGFVRAMVGGRDFETQKFNMATQAKRQPGSSVKPFIWAAAIDNGLTPSHMELDAKFMRLDGAGEPWTPQNFDDEFHGPTTLRRALEKSVNIVSIKLVERLGFPLVRSYLKSAGFKEPIGEQVGLTLGLGTPETTVIDQANSYSTLAKGGVRVDPIMITEIRDRDGFVRYDYRDYAQRSRAIPEDVAYTITYLMQGVTAAPDYEAGYYPSGWRTQGLKRPRAGKTGTTNKSRDAWFCGFTPQYTCVVWIGYEDNRPLGRYRYRYEDGKVVESLTNTGGGLAAPIWTDFMIGAHEGMPVEDFEVPAGVEFYDVSHKTGLRGGDFREVFIRGAKPPAKMPVFELPEELESFEDRDLIRVLNGRRGTR